MEKIIDIYGHNKEFGDSYTRDNSWFGRILIGEDEQFEGVVEDYFGEDYFLVFGQLTKDSMVLTKVSMEDREVPFVYEGLKNGKNKVEGAFYANNLYVEIPLGEYKISLLPADATREETDFEKKNIQRKIKAMKKELGELGTALEKDFQEARTIPVQKVQK